MKEVHPDLYVGGQRACVHGQTSDFAIIHACKSPCHQRAVGYKGNLSKSHPNYLTMRSGRHLFLNMIDPQMPLFKLPLFLKSLDFIDENLGDCKVLIHCNQGYSRAPSIALVYLSKRANILASSSFDDAKSDFLKLFPNYSPGRGIRKYLSRDWDRIQ